MPNFDTRRVLSCWVRIRSQIERIVKIHEHFKTSFRSELRQNMFLLRSARRSRHLQLVRTTLCSTKAGAALTYRNCCRCVLLRGPPAIKIDKSEDSSGRKRSSHMHKTHNNKEITCYNIVLGVADCVSLVLRMLFAKSILVKCLREISIAKNAGSHEPGMLSEPEKVFWDHNHILFYCALRLGRNRFMKFGP